MKSKVTLILLKKRKQVSRMNKAMFHRRTKPDSMLSVVQTAVNSSHFSEKEMSLETNSTNSNNSMTKRLHSKRKT